MTTHLVSVSVVVNDETKKPWGYVIADGEWSLEKMLELILTGRCNNGDGFYGLDLHTMKKTVEMAQGRFPYPVTPREQELSAIDLLQCIVHENPPMLPKEHFSAPFVDFISQVMQKLPQRRPQPGALLQHPFIRSYDDGNKQIIAEWVCQQLQELRLHGESKGL